MGFVGVFRRNAYIQRNTLSGLRFCLVMYFYVHSLRKIRALRVLLVSPRFNVTLFVLLSEMRMINPQRFRIIANNAVPERRGEKNQ